MRCCSRKTFLPRIGWPMKPRTEAWLWRGGDRRVMQVSHRQCKQFWGQNALLFSKFNPNTLAALCIAAPMTQTKQHLLYLFWKQIIRKEFSLWVPSEPRVGITVTKLQPRETPGIDSKMNLISLAPGEGNLVKTLLQQVWWPKPTNAIKCWCVQSGIFLY